MRQLLCPIERTPVVMCVGLNYKKHAEEAAVRLPPFQSMTKTRALALKA
jgi:2-keto-4-pentenoate hydratase/2-oxohepta-3-ene-1,7-dioic acid hydratase in catechol pathway